MKFDLKSVIVGLVLGGVLMSASGANTDRAAGWGLAMPRGSKALIKDHLGTALIVDIDTGKVDRVVFKNPPPDAPNYPSPKNGYELRLAN